MNDNGIPLGQSEINLKNLPTGNQEQAGETKSGWYTKQYGNSGYRLKTDTDYGTAEKNGEYFVKSQRSKLKCWLIMNKTIKDISIILHNIEIMLTYFWQSFIQTESFYLQCISSHLFVRMHNLQ